MTEVKNAHFIRIRYHGPTNSKGSRLGMSWEGWPSDGSPTVRKTMTYTSNRDEMARTASDAFCAWLNAGDTGLTYHPAEITLAAMNGADWALLVRTEAKPA